MQKGNILIFLLVGIVILGAIAGAFYLGRSTTSKPSSIQMPVSQTPPSTTAPLPSPTPDETANWKTYINTNNGFSFKYPEIEYILEELPDGSMGINYCPDKSTGNSCNSSSGPATGNLSVSVFNNSENIPLETWIQSNPALSYSDGCILKDSRTIKKQQNFLSYEALTVEYPSDSKMWQETCKGKGVSASWGSFKNIFIKKNDKIFDLSIYVRTSSNAGETVARQLDQILSTFKFTQ